MSRHTRLLGTVSVLAGALLVSGPAAADTLMGFAAMADLSYTNTSFNDDGSTDDSLDTFGGGLTIGFPVDEIPGISWQLDASYFSSSGDNSSSITWNLGGSIFWANPASRAGINVNYNTLTDYGQLTNGGVFGEYYIGNFTVQAKGGWLWGGGTNASGRGNYLGLGGVGYFIPNLAISVAGTWADLVTGAAQVPFDFQGACINQTCGRRDINHWDLGIQGEFLVSETLPISVYGGYTYTDLSISENANNPNLAGNDFTTNTFYIGVRYYLGGMGTLMDHHRSGNLHRFLKGANGLTPQ